MRVALDLTALLPQHTGVDRFMLGLVRGLAAIDRRTRYDVYVNHEDRALFAGLPENFAVRSRSLRPRAARLAFQQAVLPLEAGRRRADVVHSPAFIVPLVPSRARHVLTIHDMTSFSLPHLQGRLHRSEPYRRAVARSARRAAVVGVVSATVAADVPRWIPGVPPDRIAVIPPGVDPAFGPRSAAEVAPVLERLGVRPPYVLFVGTMHPRKNIGALVEAFGRLAPGHELVLAGRPGPASAEIEALVARGGFADRVRSLGYVGGGDLPALYAGARAFAWPSHGEGFGFPPLEAMASGVPVVVADNSSLRENLSGAAELVPATDVAALAGALERVTCDEAVRDRLVAAGRERAAAFRWEAFARGYREVYARAAAA